MVEKRKMGIHCGIPSFCSANKYVIETAIEQAQRQDDFVVIEATSNQVNQYGGYMGMRSVDFKNYVYKIADQLHFDRNKIILGGDHLDVYKRQMLDWYTTAAIFPILSGL